MHEQLRNVMIVIFIKLTLLPAQHISVCTPKIQNITRLQIMGQNQAKMRPAIGKNTTNVNKQIIQSKLSIKEINMTATLLQQ